MSAPVAEAVQKLLLTFQLINTGDSKAGRQPNRQLGSQKVRQTDNSEKVRQTDSLKVRLT